MNAVNTKQQGGGYLGTARRHMIMTVCLCDVSTKIIAIVKQMTSIEIRGVIIFGMTSAKIVEKFTLD